MARRIVQREFALPAGGAVEFRLPVFSPIRVTWFSGERGERDGIVFHYVEDSQGSPCNVTLRRLVPGDDPGTFCFLNLLQKPGYLDSYFYYNMTI